MDPKIEMRAYEIYQFIFCFLFAFFGDSLRESFPNILRSPYSCRHASRNVHRNLND